jgi:hypothetical protein
MEVIGRGEDAAVDDVTLNFAAPKLELATALWVDWYNNRRLHSSIGDRPQAEMTVRSAYAHVTTSNMTRRLASAQRIQRFDFAATIEVVHGDVIVRV